MAFNQSGRAFLITGASGGIGRACALALSQAGFGVVLHCNRGREKAEGLAAEIRGAGGAARVLSFDLSDAAATRGTLEADIESNGAYWGLVLSAGIARDAAFPALSETDWRSVIDTDLNAFFNVVQPCVMPMLGLRDGGRIIAISSVSGVAGNRGQVNYSAAKAGLIGACKALAVELAKRKVTVNAVAPGLIATEMAALEPEAMKEAMKAIPMRRMGRPEEVAALVAFLAGDAAGYITRQVISINGGMI